MAIYKKTAKDKAFDRERASLKAQISKLKAENIKLKEDLAEKEAEIQKQGDWIERLLEYTGMSESDMRRRIEVEKDLKGVLKTMSRLGFY